MPFPLHTTIFDGLVLCIIGALLLRLLLNETVGSDLKVMIIWTNLSFGHPESP